MILPERSGAWSRRKAWVPKVEMRLADCSSDDRYFEFDPKTGIYFRLHLSVSRKDRVGYSGIAQLLRSPGEGRVFVAKYLVSGDAWFSIGRDKWKLFDDTLVVKHVEVFGGLLCELSLHQHGKCVRTLRYFRRDWFAMIIDSAYDQLDFSLANLPVDFVPHDLSSPEKQRQDFIKMWSSPS